MMRSLLIFVVLCLLFIHSGVNAVLQDDSDFYVCPTPCMDTEFCGVDEQCHKYSCDTWYELGPTYYTGYDRQVSEDLDCQEFDKDDDDPRFLGTPPTCQDGLPLSVQFLMPGEPFNSCLKDQVASVPFNRKCTARANATAAFRCYDLAPSTDMDTYFEDYLVDADGIDGRHSYTLYVERKSRIVFLSLGDDIFSRTTLNTTIAQSSMRSSLSEIIEGPFPFCEPSCKTDEFCGNDNWCHVIDCENLYSYGPLSFTGKDKNEEDAGILECSMELTENTANPCSDKWPIAVNYGCWPSHFWTFSSGRDKCPKEETEGSFVSFARMCTAKPNPDQEYVCFDMKSADLREHTAEYVNDTQTNPFCDANDLNEFYRQEYGSWPSCQSASDEECLMPRHEMTSSVSNETYSTFMFTYSGNALESELDFDALEKAIYLNLKGKRQVKTPSDVDSGDQTETSGKAIVHGSLWAAMLALVLAVLW